MKLKRVCTLVSVAVTFALLSALMQVAPALAAGVITVNPTTGPAGTVVNISGTTFTFPSSYTITIDSTPVATGNIAAGGVLTATTFVMPALARGNHTIQVTTSAGAGDTSNSVTFNVTPLITLTPAGGKVGESISVFGTGFGASISVNTVFDTTTSVGSTTTNTSGSFSMVFPIPQRRGGSHIVSSTDSALNAATTSLTIVPSITSSAATTTVGAQITLTGNGFNPSVSVNISFDGASITDVTSNTNGSFTQSITVPPKAKGNYVISAIDVLASGSSTTVAIGTGMTTNPSTFTGGAQVTLSGSGFAASSPISIAIDDVVISADATTTSSTGSFTVNNFRVPELPGGSHSLKASDPTGNSFVLNFDVTQSITVSPLSGPIGTNVQVNGQGFRGTASITIRFDGSSVKTTPVNVSTDSTGKFSATFAVPGSPGGSRTVLINDGTLSASAAFTVAAGGTISVNRGGVGQSVTIGGTGFAGKGTITVTYDGSVLTTATADATGAFTATFAVPASYAGAHTFVATDGARHLSFSFTVVPGAKISPESGDVGTPITVTGSGFTARGQITVRYDAAQVGVLAADSAGSFTFVFDAPASKGGSHSVVASDGSNTVTSAFAMDATPPAVPVLLTPASDAPAEPLALFQWAGVDDPSGVTFSLQVSRDANFGVLVLDKRGLTGTGYTVAEEEKLVSASKGRPYYWRVKAIDGASNESAWTTPQTFTVGLSLPGWFIHVIYGFAIVLIGLLGFWLGGRRGRIKTPVGGKGI